MSIDREATSAAYEKLTVPWPYHCTCLYCENFVAASDLLPGEFVQFCLDAGIDARKPAEVYEYNSEQGIHYYAGFYHLVGRITSSPAPEYLLRPGLEDYPVLIKHSQPVGDFSVYLSDKPSLTEEGFPEPVVQLEFSGAIPWVLREKPGTD